MKYVFFYSLLPIKNKNNLKKLFYSAFTFSCLCNALWVIQDGGQSWLVRISMHNITIYNIIIIVFEIQLDKIKQCLQGCSVKRMQKLITSLRDVN